MRVWTDLGKFAQICATGNALLQLEKNYASLDGFVQQKMLLCSWKRIYASVDGSVRQEIMQTVYRSSILNYPAKK